MNKTATSCEYYALCDNESAGLTAHPILGGVPTCQRCADKHGLTIIPYDPAVKARCIECGVYVDQVAVETQCCTFCGSDELALIPRPGVDAPSG